MPAGIYEHDGMFSVRQTPWHGMGVVLDKHPESIEDALVKAGLDWRVTQKPVFTGEFADDVEIPEDVEQTFTQVPGAFANVRSDTGTPLGIVTSRYKPVQNTEAFEFLSSLFGSEFHFETAGSLMNGRRVWVMLKIPDFVEVGGDPIGQYAFVSNSHDGKSSVLVAVTPVRIVCENTLTAGINAASRTYSIRHIGDPSKKLVEARHALDVTINYYEKFKEQGDKLALTNLTSRKAKTMIDALIPIDPESMKERAIKNRENSREDVMSLYRYGTVVENGKWRVTTVPENAPETAWAFYNAATEYADWFRGEKKSGGRFQRTIDDPDGFKQRAWDIAAEVAGLGT